MDSVSICNLALAMLGMPSIASFDDPNNNAKLCKRFFPVLRDRCLRDHSWSFATAAAELQVTTEESFDSDYPFVCVLPGDCIRVLELDDRSAYRCVGRRILTGVSSGRVIYIRRVEDASEFDSLFVEALQYLLASELGMANTRDPQLISMYRQEYRERLASARSIDSQENYYAQQPDRRRSSWIASRRGGECRRHATPTVWTTGTEGKQ